ncbi:hypothetical protein [Leekyejoonella antrihumi]|uniref:Uncharacterized protein n=1 Tax=Leekyejoonella antrihumi TaxID=1660198 RepID=A0A563DT59_9MICO|nr:hypothetical protein [Leekyejoonella antrihumi]TWP33173.1 hypothetical protein FGL98_22140 [Leekyejoonella antrihumi]
MPAGARGGVQRPGHIDRVVSVGQVDRDGAVMVAPSQRELIHSQDVHGPGRRIWDRADQPQQRRPADRGAQIVA